MEMIFFDVKKNDSGDLIRIPATHPTREAMYSDLFQREGIGIECGVWRSGNAAALWHWTRPRKLHLCDVYGYSSDMGGGHVAQLRNMLIVRQRFAGQIDAGDVIVHIGHAHAVLNIFQDNYFDWIYLDDEHRLGHVSAELAIAAKKVRPGGILAGHDYIVPNQHNYAGHHHFGVVEAVNGFLDSRPGWEMIARTPNPHEGGVDYASYAIRKPLSDAGHKDIPSTDETDAITSIDPQPEN